MYACGLFENLPFHLSLSKLLVFWRHAGQSIHVEKFEQFKYTIKNLCYIYIDIYIYLTAY